MDGEGYLDTMNQYHSRDEAIELGGVISPDLDPAIAAYEEAKGAVEETQTALNAGAEAANDFTNSLNEAQELNLSDLGITAPEADTSATDGALADLMTQYGEIVNESPLQGEAAGQGFTDGLGGALDGAVTEAQTTATEITSAFSGLYGEMMSIGANIGNGLVSGMSSTLGMVQSMAAQLADAAASAIKARALIASPSKVTTKYGAYIGEGLALGMENSMSRVSGAAGSLGGAATDRGSILGGMSVNRGVSSGGSITFSPVINITGSNLTQQDVQGAMRMSTAEFEKMMQKYQRKRGRVAFA
jgi:hypothetical protein